MGRLLAIWSRKASRGPPWPARDLAGTTARRTRATRPRATAIVVPPPPPRGWSSSESLRRQPQHEERVPLAHPRRDAAVQPDGRAAPGYSTARAGPDWRAGAFAEVRAGGELV